jgi:hypothetical protein
VEREFDTRYNKLVEKGNIGPGSYNVEHTLSHSKSKQRITASSKTILDYKDESLESDGSSESGNSEEVLVEYESRVWHQDLGIII